MPAVGSFTDFEDALRAFESGITVQSMSGNSPPVYNGTQVITTEDFNKYKAGTLSLRDVQYTSTNFLGFIGYQFGDSVMQDMGYYNPAGTAWNSWQGTFTGRDNITSLATFKTSLQEAVILREFSLNLHYADYYLANPSIADAANPAGNRQSNGTITNTDHDINWNGYVYPTTLTAALGTTITVYERPTTNSFNPATAGPGVQITITLTGILAAGHLTGWGGVYDLLYHHVIDRDETGTPSIQYMTNYGGYDTSFFGATEAQALANLKGIRGYDNDHGTNNELPLAENLWQKDFNNDGKIGTTPVGNGDQIFVSTSANETFTGTARGNDTVNYSNATSGVTVDLSKTAAQAVGGGMGNDTLISIENIIGSAYADTLIGNSAANKLTGGSGDDRFIFNPGNGADTVTDFTPGTGTPDKIVLTAFAGLHTLNDVLADITQAGANAVINFGGGDSITLQNVQKASLSADDFVLEFYAPPALGLAGSLNPGNGWTSEDKFPRHLADVNGDGRADIVGFGNGGVYVSLAKADGTFAAPAITLASSFNPGNGWTSDNTFHRELADVNGDHMADIVGFGNGGVYVSLATGGGNFAALAVKLPSAFNPANGWTNQDQFPRQLADVNGDGKADIVAFGNSGVYVALAHANGDGAFDPVKIGLAGALNPSNGWTSQDQFPRLLGDVNGDGKADIVGFGNSGAYVALATGDGNFAAPIIGLASALNPGNGWTSEQQFLRVLADVNGDQMADIVGFGNGGVYVSLATGGGHFAAPIVDIAAFNPNNGWAGQDAFPRELADVNGDHLADIVGFGNPGVLVAINDYHFL